MVVKDVVLKVHIKEIERYIRDVKEDKFVALQSLKNFFKILNIK